MLSASWRTEIERFDDISKQIAANELLQVNIKDSARWFAARLMKIQKIKDEKKAAIALIEYFKTEYGYMIEEFFYRVPESRSRKTL